MSDGHAIRLPSSGRLVFALDPQQSEFGDEFLNAPMFLGERPPPGRTFLAGWVSVQFDAPEGARARFTLDYDAIGTDERITWGGGQQFDLRRNRVVPIDIRPDGVPSWTGGVLNLKTGQVDPTSTRIDAAFRNSVIGAVGALNRLPFLFPFIAPMPMMPDVKLGNGPGPLGMRSEQCDMDFLIDADGRIVGLSVLAKTNVPVCLFPGLGVFPPLSFGRHGRFYFSHPTSSLPGTPRSLCPTPADEPDGIHLPFPAHFRPHLSLVSEAVAPLEPLRSQRVPPGADRVIVVAGDGLLYRIGGIDDDGVTQRVDIYRAADAVWVEGPSLPIGVAQASGAYVGAAIHVFGGRHEAHGSVSNHVQVLDVRTLAWRVGPPMPVSAAGTCAATIGRRTYLAGGWTSAGSVCDQLQIFDHDSELWTLGQPMSLPVADAVAAPLDGELLVINGVLSSGATTNRVSTYAPPSGRWGVGASTAIGVACAGVAAAERRIFLIGGYTARDSGPSRLVQQLERSDRRWRPGRQLLTNVAGCAAAVLNGQVVVCGGRTGQHSGGERRITDAIQVLSGGANWVSLDRAPIVDQDDVVNAGSGALAPRMLSPGCRACIVSESLAGCGVVALTVSGLPASILRRSRWRLDFIVPDVDLGREPASNTTMIDVTLDQPDGRSTRIDVECAHVAPNLIPLDFGALDDCGFGIREYDYRWRASALASNSDGSLNCPVQPARPGDIVSLALTGLGIPSYGCRAVDIQIEIAGADSDVVGLRPFDGYRGVWLLDARVPEGLASAGVLREVHVEARGVRSNALTIAAHAGSATVKEPVPFELGVMFVLG